MDNICLYTHWNFHFVCHQVMDNLVASLNRYTQLLNPAAAKPAIAFGESDKARLAAEAVFTIANQCAFCPSVTLT